MKIALLTLTVLLISTVGVWADDAKPTRGPDTADFSQAYLDQVKTERQKEDSSEKLRREHDEYLKEIAHSDRVLGP